MNKEQLQEIIEFAIQREQDAADFYRDLAGRVNNKTIAEELLKFSEIELGHKRKLQNLDLEKVVGSEPQKVANLKIVDYMVKQEPKPNMDWHDVIAIAMQREIKSMELYRDLAQQVEDPQVKNLLENLSAEEAEHKLYFERLWDEEVLLEN